jgi:glucokinase
MTNRFALAVDVGGTKIALALVTENLIVHERIDIPSLATDGSELWGRIADAAREIINKADEQIIGVGIGSAGPIDQINGTVSPVNIPVWKNFQLVAKFREVTNSDRISLHGDAMAFANAEHKSGAGVGSRNMLGVVVSTGIGGGLIINNELFQGETGNSGYLGHSSIDFHGVKCVCGRTGCVEAYASGPSMVALAIKLGWQGASDSFIDLAAAARSGDAFALQAIESGSKALAVALVNFVGSLDIRHIVIGGGVAQAGDIYWTPLMRHIRSESEHYGFLQRLKVSPAKLTTDAGLIGAALGVLKIPNN